MSDTAAYTDRRQFSISVRSLVEFLLRSGDIDEGSMGGDALGAMKKGAKLHSRIQKKMGADYHSEVPLSFCMSYEEYDVVVSGRADGIIYDSTTSPIKQAVIDEIKGVNRDVRKMEEPVSVHLAQAKCYAYIFAVENGLTEISVQMTYGNLDETDLRKLHRFNFDYGFEELETWFLELLDEYHRWTDFQYHWELTRQDSIHSLIFPFEYRRGQKKLMQDVYRSFHAGKLLFLQAPTGTGKTIATVFPAVKAMGQGLADRIFYLTAKTAAKSVAKDTFSLLADHGLRFKAVELTAKDKICPLEERHCNPVDCPRAKGHFDRINDALYDLLQNADLIYSDTVSAWAEKCMVCPFEFSLDISSWCDGIIGDYNYVFDPHVYLKRFFGEGNPGEYLFLADEAHNLVERARDMYSAILVKEDVLAVRRLFKKKNKITTNLSKLNTLLLEWKKLCIKSMMLDLAELDPLVFTLLRLLSSFEKFFEKHPEMDGMDDVREFYFAARHFTEMAEEADDESYRFYASFDDDGCFYIKLLCIDPSKQLDRRLAFARSTVFFSATLLPVNYYKRLLCSDPSPYAIYAESSFDSDRRCVMIGGDVSSVYRRRNGDEYSKYALYVKDVVSARKGNYMVFAPSYAFLEEVKTRFDEIAPGIPSITQTKSMDEDSRAEFLESFGPGGEMLVGFCVMGGVFSEGIDLVGDRLIGAVILGCPLPMVTEERGMIRDFFGRDGFYYAYLYPAMNKVLQAAGRVIRTAGDRGVIALLDERYLHSDYSRCFPREWQDVHRVRVDQAYSEVAKFWEKVDDSLQDMVT